MLQNKYTYIITKTIMSQPKHHQNIAFITGITGQDGSYLAELLINKEYDQVHGMMRRSSNINTTRIDNMYEKYANDKLFLHYGDMTDSACLLRLLITIQPTEIYNLAAQSHVKVSFDMPEHTCDVDGLGTLRLLDAMRAAGLAHSCRFYQASSSEMFGDVTESPQNEHTSFNPRSPYACAKVFSYWIVRNYRDAYGIHASNGILFNHESPRRGHTFVTRKITRAVVRICAGKQDCLKIGNLDALRDWGHAKEYVEAMWKIIRHDKPGDYVVGTGESHTVREYVEKAFSHKGVSLTWIGTGENEVAIDTSTNKIVVKVDKRYLRVTEVNMLRADASKACRILDWVPKITFQELVSDMIESDDRELTQEICGKGIETNGK